MKTDESPILVVRMSAGTVFLDVKFSNLAFQMFTHFIFRNSMSRNSS